MRVTTARPIIGITMGDPSGIGPEITIRALLHKRVFDLCRPVVIGDERIIEHAARMALNRQDVVIHPINRVEEALFSLGTIDVLHQQLIDPPHLHIGTVDAASGEAAYRCVQKVIELALSHVIDATVTNPLNKESLNLAGHHYSGHTEIYAQLTGTKEYSMMLAEEDVRVVHVSTHVSLREACERVTTERVLQVIRLAHEACLALGITHPRIAVAGLNPHAGEHGLFGTEEIEQIIPAVEKARNESMHVEGPLPPDSIFPKARGGLYDIVVAMYHDQGHIPLKVIGFRMDPGTGAWTTVNGVNITLGLPIIRTSVDHGTAFDQAWKGTATESSLLGAIDYAIKLAVNTQTKIKDE